jgi:Fe-S-cluster containining protein
MPRGLEYLKFRCTGCGNCCKTPLLPLTDRDLERIVDRTGDKASDVVVWIDKDGIEMDDEPEAFVMLTQGKRVMVLRHQRGRCRYLGDDNRCTIYQSRPLGCRVYPFDPTFSKKGSLRRLAIVQATECPYELDGDNDVDTMRDLHERYDAAHQAFNERIADWNRLQKRRRQQGKGAQTGRQFLQYLGFA